MYGCSSAVGGKTYAVIDFLETRCKNKKIITNVKSYAKDKKNVILMTDFNKIVKFLSALDDCSGYVLFYDELFTVLGNGMLTKESREFLTQFRKRRLHAFTTCQIWSRIPKEFRDLCRYQVSTSMFNFMKLGFAILVSEINDGYNVKWCNEEQEYICPRIQTNIKKCSLKVANSYDTFEVIHGESTITR